MSNSTTTGAAVPNHVVGESRSESLLACIICMLVLSTIVMVLRLYTKLGVQRMRLSADDWTILVSWMFSVAFTANVATQTRFGLGKHVMDLPPTTNFAASLELFYFGEATYYVTVSLTKISILCLYFKLVPQKSFRILNWVMVGFVGLTGFCCVMAGIFQCNPIHKAWDTAVPGTCFNQVALYLSNAGLNIAQDIIIYFMPVKTLWQIQLPQKQRIALILVFIVGAFVCITGILRLQSLTMASVSEDPTWDNFGAAMWSSIESNVGIVCASLVHFKPLVARYAPSMLSIRRTTRLADERSGKSSNNGSSHMRSIGRSNRSKQFGVLTEMELEDHGEESSIVRAAAAGGKPVLADSASEDSEVFPPPLRGGNGVSEGGIHKTTRFTVSYADGRKL